MDTTYVISIDALDFNNLPITYQPRQNLLPIWNRNEGLSEFMINIRASEQSDTEELTPPVHQPVTTMCHICKVKVPRQFIKIHKESPKHIAFLGIMNCALKSISNHIENNSDTDETEAKNLMMYFCEHCVAGVKIDERTSHENSHSHKKAVFLDKTLSDFVKIYENNDIDYDDFNIHNDLDAPGSSQNTEIEENKFELNKYLDILINKYKMTMIFKIIDEERFEIVIDGKIVEVAAENFHGIKKTEYESLECIVCKEDVNVGDKITHIMTAKHMHRVSTPLKDIHCTREIYPSCHHCVVCNVITDNTNLHTTSDPGHQKLLQDALKPNNHDDSTENSISSENLTPVTNNTNRTDATDGSSLNKYSDFNDTSIESEDDGLSSANKTFCSHCNVYIVTKNLKKHINTKKHLCNTISKIYYIFKLDMDITSCRVCDVAANSLNEFEKHVILPEHINKYNALLATNKIRKIDNIHFYCGPCNKLVLVKNELCHIKDRGHVQFLDSNKEQSPSTSDHPTTSDYNCDVCDVKVTNTVKDIQLHNEGIAHSLKNCSLSDSPTSVKGNSYFYNYTMVETQSPNLVNCLICELLVPKDEELVLKHIESENHTGKYKKLLKDHHLVLKDDDIYCDICKVFVGLKCEIIHAEGKRHLKNLNKTEEMLSISMPVQDNAKLEARIKIVAAGVRVKEADQNVIIENFDISDNLKHLICKTCKVSVPLTKYNIRGHLEGSRHKQKVMDMEVMNSESTST